MANIMNLTKLRNKVSRNGFDLSEKNLTSAKVGELLPFMCMEVLPEDYVEIDTAWFTRTLPVNTAAYTRMREYYDWYFVPTHLLWNKFNTFVTQMTDNNQKANGINNNVVLSDEHPYFTFKQIATYLQNQNNNNMFGFSRKDLSCKLLHYLDYGNYSPYKHSGSQTGLVNPKLNPFPLLAYQKIYQDFFRDSQWEKAYAPAYNVDYMSGAKGTNNLPLSEIDYTKENMFDLRYCNWNKDYFMGLLPNSQYGDSAEALSNDTIYRRNDGTAPKIGDTLNVNYLATNGFFSLRAGETNNSSVHETTQLSILALRQAEALQKWKEITQSTSQDYKAQMQAHFNADVSDAFSDRCKYIGGIAGNLDIQPVQNQNLTGDNDANIAGRGEGGNRGKIEFKVPVHGYIMCIYHCVPLLDFAIDGIKRQNLKTFVTDYAIPEFDRTGMVQVPLIELVSQTGDADTTLLGYAPRYIEYKSSYDKVHGAFYDGGLDSWVAPIGTDYIREYIRNIGQNANGGIINYMFLKVPPSVLNPIFGVDADSTNATDQMLINCSFDIKAVRNLDRNGLPY